jgi:hypothetical protein
MSQKAVKEAIRIVTSNLERELSTVSLPESKENERHFVNLRCTYFIDNAAGTVAGSRTVSEFIIGLRGKRSCKVSVINSWFPSEIPKGLKMLRHIEGKF